MAAKAKGTPKEGQPDLSESTPTLPLQTSAPRPTTRGPSTQPQRKEGKLPPTPKETNILSGGITNRSAPRLQPNASGSATVAVPRVNIVPSSCPPTPGPSSHHNDNTIIPHMPDPSAHVDNKKPSPPSTLPSNHKSGSSTFPS